MLAGIITLIVFKALYTKDPPSKYTLEEHIERISSRVDMKYMGGGELAIYKLFALSRVQ